MENILLNTAILFGAGIIAGVLNTLAGGGSFLTVPVLMLTGLEATAANATNRLGIWIQSVFGVGKFKKMGVFPVRMSLMSALPAMAGASVGAYWATVISDEQFKKYFAVLMVVMTLVTFFKPVAEKNLDDFIFSPKSTAAAFFLYFLMGIYSGFIQAGVGFLVLAYCVTYGLDYVRGNAVKMFFNLLTATLSLAIFIHSGKVSYLPGVALGVGMALGAVFAAGFSVKAGNVFLKRFVSVAVVIFALLLLF